MSNNMFDRLTKLSGASRNRKNIDEARNVIDDLADLKETLVPWLEAAEEIRDYINGFTDAALQIDADYMDKHTHNGFIGLAEKLPLFLPEEDGELANFEEHYDAVADGLDELEGMYEDQASYSADDREEKWGEIIDACGYLATALDLLSTIGRDLEAEAEASTSSTDNEENEK